MLIANPIYDSVFKYLMEDSRAAMLLLGRITGKKIISITPRPQEILITRDNPAKHSVYRMDFSAVVQTHSGKSNIIVEVQKAKRSTDILRFRRYIGKQYSNPENVIKTKNGKAGIPIISIYFLGHDLDEDIDAPVLKIARNYTDLATKKVYNVKDPFIESLTHDSYVIQITRLKKRRRNILEKVLAVFDPEYIADTEHFLNVDESNFPPKYYEIIKRLNQAAADEKMREVMHVEDEILRELISGEQAIEEKEKALKALSEKEKIIEEKDRILEDTNKMLEDTNKMLESKVKIIEKTILRLHKSGHTPEEIAQIMELTIEKIKAII